MKKLLEVDTKKTMLELVSFLSSSFEKEGFSRAVIALSGGVDSATACALAVRALGKGNVCPVLLPYKGLNPQGLEDAQAVITSLEIPVENAVMVNIAPFVDPMVSRDPAMDRVRRGNIMARVRMTLLFDQAKKRHALVIGTENKSEHMLGYYTRFGDEASDVEPLRGLYKTQVYQLARYLGVPEVIVEKTPTAGLWEGQTDEGDFGFSYAQADEILFLLYDKRKSTKEIVMKRIPYGVVEKVKAWVKKNSFKHHLPFLP